MRRSFTFGLALGIAALFPFEVLGQASIPPPYNSSYSLVNLGGVAAVPGPYGGIAFLDPNTLLIGGNANNSSGAIYSIGVVRNALNHITGFTGSATLYRNAPNIDGGLAFGPGGVLFATTYSNNNLLEYRPGGGLNPDRAINLSPLGVAGSTGTVQFVPAGYGLPDAGGLRILSYSGGTFYTATLTPDGLGTYDVSNVVLQATPGNGPEGMIYVPPGSPVFNPANHYALISEYGAGRVSAYQLDANGFPIPATQSTFVTGLSGAEGAIYDPVSGDFLFSTFGGGNQVFEVNGFAVVPEPATILLGGASLGAMLLIARKKIMKRKRHRRTRSPNKQPV